MALNDSNRSDDFDNAIVVSPSINTGVDGVLSLTTTPQEVKVGINRLTGRKWVLMQATTVNVKWGFDSNCRFDLFKNQLLVIPVENAPIWMKVSVGTGEAIIGEGSVY